MHSNLERGGGQVDLALLGEDEVVAFVENREVAAPAKVNQRGRDRFWLDLVFVEDRNKGGRQCGRRRGLPSTLGDTPVKDPGRNHPRQHQYPSQREENARPGPDRVQTLNGT